jgi:hypothetical protein
MTLSKKYINMTIVWVINNGKDTRFWRDNNWILNYDTLEINFLDCMLGVLRDFFN